MPIADSANALLFVFAVNECIRDFKDNTTTLLRIPRNLLIYDASPCEVQLAVRRIWLANLKGHNAGWHGESLSVCPDFLSPSAGLKTIRQRIYFQGLAHPGYSMSPLRGWSQWRKWLVPDT